jgi:hypothetical protein
MTVRGAAGYRAICVISLWLMGALFASKALGQLSDRGDGGTIPGIGLAVASGLVFCLSARAVVSRVDVNHDQIRLYYLVRTRRIVVEQVQGFSVCRFNGWDALAIELSNGISYRLPLLTQPSTREGVLQLKERLEGALTDTDSSSM